MNDLVAFLRARLAEDAAAGTPGRGALDDLRFELKRGDPYEQHLSGRIEDGLDAQTMVWEARVLPEVEAKRAILGWHPSERMRYIDASRCPQCELTWPCPTVRAIAAVYSGHPDYDPAWKP